MKKSLCKQVATILIFASMSGLTYSSDIQHLNEGLPVMVDSKTELNDILLKDMTVIYTYKLKDINIKQALSIKEENKIFIEENACEDVLINDLFNKDLGVKFVYKLADEKILEVNVNKEFCRQLNDRSNCENRQNNRKINFNHLS